ncbi:MAG: Tfp pilus assembly protein PilF, partial [Planctomycetota bacterium]
MHKLPLTVFISAGLILAMPVNTSAQSNGSQSDASAAEDDVTALVRRGRTKLDAGDAAEAQVLFEEAAAKADNSLATRMWVLRAWMEQGRSNDTLDALDA